MRKTNIIRNEQLLTTVAFKSSCACIFFMGDKQNTKVKRCKIGQSMSFTTRSKQRKQVRASQNDASPARQGAPLPRASSAHPHIWVIRRSFLHSNTIHAAKHVRSYALVLTPNNNSFVIKHDSSKKSFIYLYYRP